MRRNYTVSNIFADHCLDLRYINLRQQWHQRNALGANIVALWSILTVIIGSFQKKNIENIFKKGWIISYYIACAHFQNANADKAIQGVQSMERTMLLHAKAIWIGTVHLSLWPYEMRLTVHVVNHLPDEADDSSCNERFCECKCQHNFNIFILLDVQYMYNLRGWKF